MKLLILPPPKRIPGPSPYTGQGAIFLCALFWSTSGLFIKLVSWHPVTIAASRSFIAALFLLGIRLLFPRRGGGKSRPRAVLAGGLAYAATMLAFVIANKLTASANAILLQYSAPVWAALIGWALIREKPRGEHWGALIMVMGGLLLFFKDGLTGGSALGNGIALLSGVFFGANSVFMRMQKDGNPADSMLLAHLICTAIGIPFFFFFPPALTVSSLSAILFMGIIQIGCASLLFSYGIKRVTAIQAMLTAMAEPILNPVWVFAVTGEKPASSALLGGSIIVAAVMVSSLISTLRQR
ncbi:MAG: DMT family transporter [Treponema sp.]|jgi:drug/metabolite transporter (DMT)-like permease|nr:DMT family transporter [Treponema sp.]